MSIQTLILDNGGVCNNCLRLRREPDGGHRDRTTTSVEHVPHGLPTHSQVTFCSCGVEDAYTQLWDDDMMERRHVKNLLKRSMLTLEAFGTVLDRLEFATWALQKRTDGASVHESLEAGYHRGVLKEPDAVRPEAN